MSSSECFSFDVAYIYAKIFLTRLRTEAYTKTIF